MASKRHHYVLQFYLRGFADEDGRFCVYEKGKDPPRVQTPLNTAVIGHFYTFNSRLRERQPQFRYDDAERGVEFALRQDSVQTAPWRKCRSVYSCSVRTPRRRRWWPR